MTDRFNLPTLPLLSRIKMYGNNVALFFVPKDGEDEQLDLDDPDLFGDYSRDVGRRRRNRQAK